MLILQAGLSVSSMGKMKSNDIHASMSSYFNLTVEFFGLPACVKVKFLRSLLMIIETFLISWKWLR